MKAQRITREQVSSIVDSILHERLPEAIPAWETSGPFLVDDLFERGVPKSDSSSYSSGFGFGLEEFSIPIIHLTTAAFLYLHAKLEVQRSEVLNNILKQAERNLEESGIGKELTDQITFSLKEKGDKSVPE